MKKMRNRIHKFIKKNFQIIFPQLILEVKQQELFKKIEFKNKISLKEIVKNH